MSRLRNGLVVRGHVPLMICYILCPLNSPTPNGMRFSGGAGIDWLPMLKVLR